MIYYSSSLVYRQIYHRSNSFSSKYTQSKRWYVARNFQTWYAPSGYGYLARKWNQSEAANYFGGIIIGFAFSLTWPAAMQIGWSRGKYLHEKKVQPSQDWFGTPTWGPFHCLRAPIWQTLSHLKTLHMKKRIYFRFRRCYSLFYYS